MPGLYSKVTAMGTCSPEQKSRNVSKATLWDKDVETKTDQIRFSPGLIGVTHSNLLHSQTAQEFIGPTTGHSVLVQMGRQLKTEHFQIFAPLASREAS